MIDLRLRKEIHRATGNSRLGIGRAKDDIRNPSMKHRSRTHCAGLKRDIQTAVIETVVAQPFGRRSQRDHLRMGRGIMQTNGLIKSLGDDLSLPDHYRPDGDLAGLARQDGLGQGHSHEKLVLRLCHIP